MISWRITKYNTKYRNENDEYQKSEWTSYHDIGKFYGGKEFTIKDYIVIEDAYINAILLFLKYANITTLTVKCLEKNNYSVNIDDNQLIYTEEMIKLYEDLYEGYILEIKEIEYLCRLVLREQLWCKLEGGNKIFIHFGYDYYMYIGCLSKPKGIERLIKEMGLFIEKYESPYL